MTPTPDLSLLPDGRYQGGEEFTLKIRALRSTRPPIIRLRKILKAMLRAEDFKCVQAEETTPTLPRATLDAMPTTNVEAAGAADGSAGVGDR